MGSLLKGNACTAILIMMMVMVVMVMVMMMMMMMMMMAHRISKQSFKPLSLMLMYVLHMHHFKHHDAADMKIQVLPLDITLRSKIHTTILPLTYSV